MTRRESGETIDAEAARWIARLDRHGHDEDLNAQLEAWLDGDSRRQGAYLRARAAFTLLDRPDAWRLAGDEFADERHLPLVSRRQLVIGGGVAGAAAVAGGIWLTLPRQEPGLLIGTQVGEIRRIPLADGSIAVINTASELVVAMSAQERRVTLNRGEAWFQVAHDKARPFIVAVDDVETKAVGTAFSVRRMGADAGIIVTNGIVEVKSQVAGTPVRRVPAGWQTLAVSGQGPEDPTPAGDAIERSLAWRDGEIVLQGETLDEAVAQFNRYNTTQMAVVGVALGQRRIVGRFRTNEVEGFANAAVSLLGAKVAPGHDGKILLIEKN